MFSSNRFVFLRDTDATGVIYFTSLLHYSLEAFELFLQKENQHLAQLLSEGYLFPIVHAESDYKGPLRVGDEMVLSMYLEKITKRSFSIKTEIRKSSDGELVGLTKIVHAFVLKGESVSSEIPIELVSLLQTRLG